MLYAMCLCLDLSFPCVVWLDLHVSMLVHMFFYLDLHVLCFMPCFPMLCSSFCSMLMLGLHAHMLVRCFWLCLAWIYVFMPMLPCYRVRSLSSHAYMLEFTFFHVYVLGSTCWHACFYAYMSRFMFSHAYMLGSMFSTCFILSSMCLCAPCHICVLRPRLCLSCHVLL